MGKVVLHDDPAGGRVPPFKPDVILAGDGMGVPVALVEDPYYGSGLTSSGQPMTVVNPTLTVRCRSAEGFDSDGNAVFAWVDLVTAQAIRWIKRTELDDEAAVVRLEANAVIPFVSDGVQVDETIVVWDDDGNRWRCNTVETYADRLELTLECTDG